VFDDVEFDDLPFLMRGPLQATSSKPVNLNWKEGEVNLAWDWYAKGTTFRTHRSSATANSLFSESFASENEPEMLFFTSRKDELAR